ncbi:hypothetical protein [Synechococcus sp. 1G10]|uniref:hypothetical protein n=1 Tax=Synechococcus sp. 1G10 TaxID=2025605 RepID=UPI000B998335|nr:hypothetical protein [Synechococcus sp. 1G10]
MNIDSLDECPRTPGFHREKAELAWYAMRPSPAVAFKAATHGVIKYAGTIHDYFHCCEQRGQFKKDWRQSYRNPSGRPTLTPPGRKLLTSSNGGVVSE